VSEVQRDRGIGSVVGSDRNDLVAHSFHAGGGGVTRTYIDGYTRCVPRVAWPAGQLTPVSLALFCTQRNDGDELPHIERVGVSRWVWIPSDPAGTTRP
jgi:hypothetical protein